MIIREIKYIKNNKNGNQILLWETETTSFLRKLFKRPNKVKTYYYAPIQKIAKKTWLWKKIPENRVISSQLTYELDREYYRLRFLKHGRVRTFRRKSSK